VWDVTQSEREEAANTLLNCIDAVFKQLKLREPAAHPWIGNMLGTEHLRQLGTSVFIQITRWGSGPPAGVIPASAPAAQGTLPTPKTASDTSKAPAKRPRASAGPAHVIHQEGQWYVVCPACGEEKPWHLPKPPWKNAVCIDCYKAGVSHER